MEKALFIFIVIILTIISFCLVNFVGYILFVKINMKRQRKELEKRGYVISDDEFKRLYFMLEHRFGIDLDLIELLVFDKGVAIFKCFDYFILATDDELKVLTNEDDILSNMKSLAFDSLCVD